MPFLKYSADLKKFKLIPEVDFEINRPSYSPSYPTVIYRGMDGRMGIRRREDFKNSKKWHDAPYVFFKNALKRRKINQFFKYCFYEALVAVVVVVVVVVEIAVNEISH